jgi:hydroxylaminobenzene mutase
MAWHVFVSNRATGFAEHFANARMGLAAHLESVMNGAFLIALGALWTEARQLPRTKAIGYWTALYGKYGNWLVTTLAAAFGTAVFLRSQEQAIVESLGRKVL